MDAESFRRVEPSEFYKEFFSQEIRPDGRSFSTFRRPLISNDIIRKCHGSASLRCGNSFYLALVQGEIAAAKQYRDTVGMAAPLKRAAAGMEEQCSVNVNVQFPKTYGFEIKDALGPSTGVPYYLASTLSDILNSSDVLDKRQLQIDTNGAAWVLSVNVLCIEYDGNYTDLPLLAIVAALEATKLPSVYWDSVEQWWREAPGKDYENGNVELWSCVDGEVKYRGMPLHTANAKLLNRPLSVTFANVLEGYWIADPCKEEEELGTSLTLYRIRNKWFTRRLGGRDLPLIAVEGKLEPIASMIMDGFESILDEIKKPQCT